MKIIVPCCGSSSRFPGQPPKWMLPGPDGRPMICLAIDPIDFALDDLVIAILAEHEQRFAVRAGLESLFGRRVETVVLAERTRSQSETVAVTLRALGLDEPFLVKDSDGAFQLAQPDQPENYVCCDSLNHFDLINPRNKSYVQVDGDDRITAIREKVVISDLFNVGGYFFRTPREFLDYYDRLSASGGAARGEMYLSHVIAAMLVDGATFRARRVAQYRDWGTVHEWRRELLQRQTYFVMLDGFALERGSAFFRPTFAEVKPNPGAVEAIQSLARQGHTLIYLSNRPPTLESMTRAQMTAAELPDGAIVWSCPIAKWSLITAPHATLPFVTSRSAEIAPDRAELLLSLGDG